MRMLFAAALLTLALPAQAQTPDWRSALLDLYRIDMAIDACPQAKPSAADLQRLEAAIDYVEEKTGLGEDDLDEAYGEIESEAAELPAFCKRMAEIRERIQKIPQGYR